ncbi:hypothetical protein [Clostridium gasigenes]|nr:hypothetical protein [Clostridium gasigenes]MBU3105492.1 hypothetical protein [Clostridium gasigenes]MBU3138007.1 hypothetical protein [Clostridium gasigenes]
MVERVLNMKFNDADEGKFTFVIKVIFYRQKHIRSKGFNTFSNIKTIN